MTTEQKLVSQLRDEASELKECFTRYSFQTISASLVALGLVARMQSKYPQMGLVSALVIFFVFAVLRIGLYKYYGANRIYGFELHLARMDNLRAETSCIPKEKLTGISWEEAMRAWRIVQPTMFAAIYEVKKPKLMRFFAATPKLKAEFVGKKDLWFKVESLIDSETTFHMGSYLRTIFSTLYIIIYLALASLFYMNVQVYKDHGLEHWLTIVSMILTATITFMTIQRLRQFTARRLLLEDGMHSIHSCGIAWHFVIVAHFRALRDLGAQETEFIVDELKGYSASLSKQAKTMLPHLKYGASIYEWLATPSEKKPVITPTGS